MPKDEQMRKQWVVKIRRDVGPNFKITSKTRVCSKHFKEEDFRPPDNSGRRLLKEGTLPSVFDWTATTNTRRKVLRHDVCESGTQTDESDMEADDASNQPPKSNQAQSICEELQQTKAQLAATQAELTASRREVVAAKEELQVQKEKAAAEVVIYKFGLERFFTNNDAIKFYTGFCSYKHFQFFFYNFAKPSAETTTYCYATGLLVNRPNIRAMQLLDELFMFLVTIRLGLFQQDLAHRFNLHVSTVSRKTNTWANYLYFLLRMQPIWPTRADVRAKMPAEFKSLYPTTRVILDCTEIFVETPSSLLLQSQLYSSYKSSTTIKSLVGIALHGATTFVSSMFTGSISDRKIYKMFRYTRFVGE
uniref:uncharacterized protein LOC108950989 n=1 Tax=Ciona intestinalis TaxID=7719 RepID=UPI00089DBDB5|nr:uncharacterized protein LOC108950989 [Ciona intestinalis]|eukprot:XP_018672850.1 uncharacterized protein LOC108950989 [Ciona intestinalis]